VALLETFAQPPAPAHAYKPDALPSLLREADLEMIPVATGSKAAGKFIRELQLRTATGASIVGVERSGMNIINPGPDEELHPGDHVLLLGTASQLQAAKALFEAPLLNQA
jgi:CPA2 family monovalent cation:H+ antiporter-2